MKGIQFCCLFLAVNTGQTARTDQDAWKDDWRGRIVEWRQALDGMEIDDSNLAHLVEMLDPRPRASVRPFKDERLAKHLQDDSREWISGVFQPRANPFQHGLKGPTGYDLAPAERRWSNLRYEWETPIYRFEIIESACAIALKARPRTGKWWEKTGVPAGRVEDMIRALLREGTDESGKPAPLRRFPLSAVVKAGKPFTNHPGGFTMSPQAGWPEGVVGFVTLEGLTLIIPKSPPIKPYSAENSQFTIHPQTLYFCREDGDWLPTNLFAKDTDQLVIEKLWGKPYPRPKVQTSK